MGSDLPRHVHAGAHDWPSCSSVSFDTRWRWVRVWCAPSLHRPQPPLLLGVDRATAIEPCLRWGESFSWAELHIVIAHPGAVNGNHLFPTPGPCELRVCHYLLHHHLPPLPGQGHGITKPGVLRLVAPPARCLSAGQREFTLLAQHLFYRKFIFVS